MELSQNRRNFLKMGLLGTAGAALAPVASSAVAQSGTPTENFTLSDLRGSFNANQSGLRPGAIDDQGKLLQKILLEAAREDKPVFLPPGNYFVSNIVLPKRTRLMGVPGASKLIYTGGGHFIMGENGSHIEMTGLVFDGANRGIANYSEAAIRIIGTKHLVIDNCQVLGSLEKGIQVDRSTGRIERNRISGATGLCGIYGIENRGMLISGNHVHDCFNGGILVHRWSQGEDGTIVSNNRIERIGAANGGTGQWGNGINIFRADNVTVSNNHITGCALSAIRSNSGNNVQITGNQCHKSGETGIYSEFKFNGAVISNNVVDGGARGISIANFDQDGRMAICSGNLIRNIHETPPYPEENHIFGTGISAEAETAITGNVIEGIARFGILLGWGPYLRNVVVTSNIVRQSDVGAYVSVVKGIRSVVMTDNVFSQVKNSAIRGYEWHKPVTGELVSGNEPISNLTIARNSVS